MDNRTYYSKEWKKFKKDVFERDNYRCTECGVGGKQLGEGRKPTIRLQVHHITSVHDGGDIFDMDNCITLCPKCHLKADAVVVNHIPRPTMPLNTSQVEIWDRYDKAMNLWLMSANR